MRRPDRPVRVLVVDDSPFVRDMVTALLESDPDVTVAGHASNGSEAVSQVLALSPDIVTMDIEMPVMGGLEAIERIMAQRPVPILVLTSVTGVRTAFAAVSKGALDVLEKPDIDGENGRKLLKKVKMLSRVDVVAHQTAMSRRAKAQPDRETVPASAPSGRRRIVAIASSTGGPRAIHAILSELPTSFPAPIVISQHVADGFTSGMAEWLGGGCALKVSTASKGDLLLPGRVYLNPSESVLRVTGQGVVLLEKPRPGQLYHPSCDAMLESVAASYGKGAVGVILTGMGDDGVAGIRAVKEAGGFTLAQDEQSSVVYGMNGLAVKRGCVDKVLPLAGIPGELLRLFAAGGS